VNYKQILARSWEIAKTHKVLWVFGMVVAALSGGSANFNLSGDQSAFSDLFQKSQMKEIPQETSNVLGTYTDTLSEMVRNISPWVWLVLAVSIFLAILAAIAISLYLRYWARGALIASIHDIEEGRSASLELGSRRGREVVRRLIYMNVAPWLVLMLAIAVIAGVSVVLLTMVNLQPIRIVVVIIMSLLFLTIGVIGGIALVMTLIIAEQIVVRENCSSKEALKKGLKLAKKYLGQLFAMGAINLGIGCAVGCATVFIFLLLAAVSFIVYSIDKHAGIVIAVIAALLVFVFLLISLLLRGIYMVFNTSTWTLLFREIEKLEKGGKNAV
jgi:hypothetical protein